MSDRRIVYAASFLRSLTIGMGGVLIGLYLAKLRFDPAEIGLVVSAGLAGGAVTTLLATFRGDRIGRKRLLIALCLVGAAGGAAVALASSVAVMALASFVGMLNGMGRDRGAALVLEQAILPGTATDRDRTRTFAWYNVLQDGGGAAGSALVAIPAVLRGLTDVGEVTSFRVTMGLYALLVLAGAALYAGLSPAAEGRRPDAGFRMTPHTRRVLWKISPLFALDSLGGGFLTAALLSFFFYERFGAGEVLLGALFFGSRVANALSHLGAAWLARRIGLVKTMVFTHIPSSLLLATVPFAPNFWVAAALFLVREGLVEMDVPTRQSYVMGVVLPEERTFASGVTHLVRIAAWAVAPYFAGLFMRGLSLGTPLFIGSGMKIVYDLLLYAALRQHPPPEEVKERVLQAG